MLGKNRPRNSLLHFNKWWDIVPPKKGPFSMRILVVIILLVLGGWFWAIRSSLPDVAIEKQMRKAQRLSGTIAGIEGNSIRVKNAKGHLVQVAFDGNSKYVVKTAPEIMSHLREDQHVLVFLDHSEKGDWVVLAVFPVEPPSGVKTEIPADTNSTPSSNR